MSLLSALALARDLGVLLALAVCVLGAAAFWSGAGALSAGLAASAATIAVSALATLTLYGVAATIVEPPVAWFALVVGLAALAGAAAAAVFLGVRGFWLATLIAVGVALAIFVLASFARRLDGAFAPIAPLAVFAILALLAAGALGAAARAAAPSAPTVGLWGDARRAFATPADWFDCLYATFGGSAARPGFCAFNAPQVATDPDWTEAPTAAPTAPAPPTRPADPPPPSVDEPSAPNAPSFAAAPAAPATEIPNFAAVLAGDDPTQEAPAALSAPTPPSIESTPLTARLAPSGAQAPEAIVETPDLRGDVADAQPVGVETALAAPVAGAPTGIAAPEGVDAAAELSARSSASMRTEFVCFPMLSVHTEQLCPDERLGISDFEVEWRSRGGETVAAVDGVECFVDREFELHATFAFHASAALSERIPKSAAESAPRAPKAEALFEMVTRFIGAGRAAAVAADDPNTPSDRLLISAFVSGGGRYETPWVQQDYGGGRIDRVFDVRSSGHTLPILRRLRAETQNLGAIGRPFDFGASLARLVAERPRLQSPRAQSVLVFVIDTADAALITQVQEAQAIEALRAWPGQVVLIELGAFDASAPLLTVSEAVGGSAIGVWQAAGLVDMVDRVIRRARTFCALRVSAPEGFFEANDLTVRLRRRMTDGCRHVQIATLSCGSVRMEQRVDPVD